MTARRCASQRRLWLGDGTPGRTFHPFHVLRSKAEVLMTTGGWDQAAAILERNLSCTAGGAADELCAETCVRLARLLLNRGQYPEALALCQRARGMFDRLGDRRGLKTALGTEGVVHWRLGRLEEAGRLFRDELDIAQSLDDQVGSSTALNNLGNLYLDQRRYQDASACYRQSREIDRALGDRHGLCIGAGNLGYLYYVQQQFDQAMDQYQRQLTMAVELGDRMVIGVVSTNIGNVLYMQGDYGQAMQQYDRSLAIARALGDRRAEALATCNIGMVLEDQGDPHGAAERYRDSLRLYGLIGDEPGMLAVLGYLITTLRAAGDRPGALACCDRAAEIGTALGAAEQVAAARQARDELLRASESDGLSRKEADGD